MGVMVIGIDYNSHVKYIEKIQCLKLSSTQGFHMVSTEYVWHVT